MRKLLLLKDIKFLKRYSSFCGPDAVLIDIDIFKSAECANTFEEIVYKPILFNVNKESVEKEYIDLIADIGKDKALTYWWASALSEKNSFSSKLFTRLYRLVCLYDAVGGFKDRDIIVFTTDAILLKQISINYGNSFKVYYPCIYRVILLYERFKSVSLGIAKQFYKCIKEYKNLIYARKYLADKKTYIQSKKNFNVLRTWSDKRSYKTGVYKDPYFGSLPDFLLNRKENVLIFSGIISSYRESIDKFAADKGNLIMPINLYLKVSDIIRSLFLALFKRPRIRNVIISMRQRIDCLIEDELLQDISTISYFINSIINYYCCLRLGQNVTIRRFIYTFENYAWEKMSILGLRAAIDDISIIGFQHSFIGKNSFKFFPGKGEDKIMPLPDKIVTIGMRTQQIMKNKGNYPHGIFLLGAALRQEHIFKIGILPRNNSGYIFVPLSITGDDTLKVLSFLVDAGLDRYERKVVLRFHPATRVDKVIKKLGRNISENFIISDNPPINEEIEKSSIVLYSWTTACLEALKMGRPLIYLDVNYPLEVDPLFENNYLKDTCSKPAELISKINRIRNLSDIEFNEQLNKAEEYISQYFTPVDNEKLQEFIF